jgi:hypothetical protein
MPMLLTRRKPDDITRVDFLDRAAPSLHPAAAGRDDQGLTEGMGVPCRARARLEGDAGATSTCWIGRLEQRVNTNSAGEIIRWPLARRLFTRRSG